MTTVQINDDNLLSVLAAGTACLVVILSLAGWLLLSGKFATGVAIGGGLALANFFWLRNALQQVLKMPVEKATRAATVRYLSRLTALGFILWLLIVKGHIDVPGLLVGLSVLVIGIILMTLYRLLHTGG